MYTRSKFNSLDYIDRLFNSIPEGEDFTLSNDDALKLIHEVDVLHLDDLNKKRAELFDAFKRGFPEGQANKEVKFSEIEKIFY